jgi:hypothetical protein
MNVQRYIEASQQRLQLRRDLTERLQQLRDATGMLGAAATGVRPAPAGPPPEDPLAQIDPLCSGARSLTQMLRRSHSEIAAAEDALETARILSQRLKVLAFGGLGMLAAVVVVAVVVLLLHSG